MSNTQHESFKPFTYKTLEDLKKELDKLNLNIPISSEVEILQQKVNFRKKYIANRLAIQPMEGFDSEIDGRPSNLTMRRYQSYAKGGAGLIWFEATAIQKEGRTNQHQLMLTTENLNDFKSLINKTRESSREAFKDLSLEGEVILILQLNHSGRYSKKDGKPSPIRTYQQKNAKEEGTLITDNQLEELEAIWVEKALLAKEAGFDGVDIKACHGYLISDLLKARTREGSKYGGYTFENRTKFYLNIMKKLNNEIKNNENFFLTSRLGVYDGFPYPNGFGIAKKEGEKYPATIDLDEPIKLIKKLYDIGMRMINISAGNPYYKPHITRPYDTPLKGETLPNEHPLYSTHRIISLAAIVRKEMPKDMIIIGSGYSYLRQFAGHIAAGLTREGMVDICGFGRMAFANPEFPRQIFQDGTIDKKKTCITCSKCTERMRNGLNTGCVVRDPLYKKS